MAASAVGSQGPDKELEKPLRIGLVGAGQVAQMCHIAPLAQLASVELAGIADLRPRLAKVAADRFAIPHVFESHKHLVDALPLDAVVVVTNRDVTGPIVRDVLDAGISVMCEKPFTHAIAQAEPLVTLAAERGVCLAVACMKRHDPGLLRAAELLERLSNSKEWGALIRVEAWSLAGDAARPPTGFVMTDEGRPAGLETWPIAPYWLAERHHPEYANFLNVHVHALNWLAGLLGPLNVAFARRKAGEGFEIGFATDRTPVTLECGYGRGPGWHEGTRFVFETGAFILRFPAPFDAEATATLTLEEPLEDQDTGDSEASWAFARQAHAFVTAVQKQLPPLVSGRDAVADLAVSEEIWRMITRT